MELYLNIVIMLVMADTFEMAPAYDSPQAIDEAALYNTDITSVFSFDDYPPVNVRSYADFDSFAAPLEYTNTPSERSSKLSSRRYAEFHTQRAENVERDAPESTSAMLSPAFEVLREVGEKVAEVVGENNRGANTDSFQSDPAARGQTNLFQPSSHPIENNRLPSVVQKSTQQFLDILASHVLLKPSFHSPRFPLDTRGRGVLDLLTPSSRLDPIKSYVDYFRKLLSSTF